MECPVRAYIFCDLILATRCIELSKCSNEVDISKEEVYIKIYLDGFSFVRAPSDGRYLQNRLSVTGKR